MARDLFYWMATTTWTKTTTTTTMAVAPLWKYTRNTYAHLTFILSFSLRVNCNLCIMCIDAILQCFDAIFFTFLCLFYFSVFFNAIFVGRSRCKVFFYDLRFINYDEKVCIHFMWFLCWSRANKNINMNGKYKEARRHPKKHTNLNMQWTKKQNVIVK